VPTSFRPSTYKPETAALAFSEIPTFRFLFGHAAGMSRGTGSTACAKAAVRSAPSFGIETARAQAVTASTRLGELGDWPEWIDRAHLAERIPSAELTASGFDAGIACALDLIPRDRQRLSAKLHAAYTPEAVAQVRHEAAQLDPDSETAWWLAACEVCTEGKLSPADFLAQVDQFTALAADPAARLAAAQHCLAEMTSSFTVENGVAFSRVDGGMQGAYVAGHELAGMYAAEHDLYFLGTFHDSLGLEDFAWSEETDEQGRPRSGPNGGSRQFVKCANEAEYRAAAALAATYLA
jgi:hypothetical protein